MTGPLQDHQIDPDDPLLGRVRAALDELDARWDRAQFDTAQFDTAQFDTAQFDTAQFDTARFDTARFDMARFDMARFDAVEPDTAASDAVLLAAPGRRSATPRWLAAAVVIAMLAAAAAWAMARRTTPPARVSPSPSPVSSSLSGPVAPTSTSGTPSTGVADAGAASPTATLELPGFVPAMHAVLPASADSAVPPVGFVQAWAVPQSLTGTSGAGALVVEVDSTTVAVDDPGGGVRVVVPTGWAKVSGDHVVWHRADGNWRFTGPGLSADALARLVPTAQPGSGLPVVMPSLGGLIGMGSRTVRTTVQRWDSGSESVGVTWVRDATALNSFTSGSTLVALPGSPTTGFRATQPDGSVRVVWSAGDGWWGDLLVPSGLAERADQIVTALGVSPSAYTGPNRAASVPVDVPSVSAPDASAPVTSSGAASAAALYTTTGMLIQQDGKPAMVAYVFAASLPPQGGNVPVTGIDWAQVPDAHDVDGTHWTDSSYVLVGTFDGTTLTLTQPPSRLPAAASTGGVVVGDGSGSEVYGAGGQTGVLGPDGAVVQPATPITGTIDAPTPLCSPAITDAAVAAVSVLGRPDIITVTSDARHGHCGAVAEVTFESPGLLAAIATLGPAFDVVLQPKLHPLSDGTG